MEPRSDWETRNRPRTTRSSEDHVRVLRRGGDGGDPAGVASEGTLESERLSHF